MILILPDSKPLVIFLLTFAVIGVIEGEVRIVEFHLPRTLFYAIATFLIALFGLEMAIVCHFRFKLKTIFIPFC